MFLNPKQQQQYDTPVAGLTGSRPANVKETAQASHGYQTALQGANIVGGLHSLAKGRAFPGLLGMVGAGAAGGLITS